MQSGINVCHFATLTRRGGTEIMLLNLLGRVRQEQIHHLLLTTSSAPELIAVVREMKIRHFQPQTKFRYNPRKFIDMASWLRAEQVQAVYSYGSYANAWAGITSLIAESSTFITSEHGTVWNDNAPMSWLDRWAQRRAKLNVANSGAAAKLLEIRYGIRHDKIRLLYNGVPDHPKIDVAQMRARLQLDHAWPVVGSIGRLDTPKDFVTFVHAAALVCKAAKSVVFVLVGGGPFQEDLMRLASGLGLEENFRFTGWQADARSILSVFDIFVSTSIHESFGNVLVEAALAEKPVIAPEVDGIPEVVLSGQTGILLRPTIPIRRYRPAGSSTFPKSVLLDSKLQPPRSLDPGLLSDTILDLLERPDLRLEFGQAARARALQLFSMERYVRDLEGIFHEVLDGG